MSSEPGPDGWQREPAYPPIKDYAIIGDCGCAALVDRSGSIDWLCWPRFDSPSVFAALLDRERGGFFYVRPTGRFRATRRYVGPTNVLETTFETANGVLRLTDLMPVNGDDALDRALRPDHEILRRVECLSGEVEVEVRLVMRPDYGARAARFEDRGALGYVCDDHGRVTVLRTDLPVACTAGGDEVRGRSRLRAGDRRYLALTYDEHEPAVLPLLGEDAERRIDATLHFWNGWAAVCTYDGPFRDAVVRSALVLKLLTYSRSGAIVAAPTTSLPEEIGGVRNWDYRYCWVRDASFTLYVLFELGYYHEGEAFFSWLLHAIGGTQPTLSVMYDLHGRTNLEERVLAHLEGYRESRPVRIGNGAHDQLQLDIYGEVIATAYEFVRRGEVISPTQERILRRLGRFVLDRWEEPDAGIWEIRSAPRHHTYSKAMCWVAVDRLIRLHETWGLRIPVEDYRRAADEIRGQVLQRGYNGRLRSFVSEFDGDQVDASLLLLPLYGFIEADDPRMCRTYDLVIERLARGTLLYRYAPGVDDGLPGEEGTFGICSTWDDAYMARRGDVDAAAEHLARFLEHANDVGLMAEELNPQSGEALGNFPQAFTHVGIINAALAIEQERTSRGRPPAPSGAAENLQR